MGDNLRKEGFPASKITTICNFIDQEKLTALASMPVRERGEGYYCYIGRLSAEKGVPTLLEAADNAGVRMKVAGDGPLRESLEERFAANEEIEFLGRLGAQEVVELLNGADAMAISSECFENNPLSVIESLCAGTPVIGAEIGGIPELIAPTNGRLYPSGDVEALTALLRDFDTNIYDRSAIASRARSDFNEEAHYQRLLDAYTK